MSDFCSGRIDAGFQSKKLELVCQLERFPRGVGEYLLGQD